MSYVTHQYDNAYVTAGPMTRLLSSLIMREGFEANTVDCLDAAYCLDSTSMIVGGSTEYGYTVVGTSCTLRD